MLIVAASSADAFLGVSEQLTSARIAISKMGDERNSRGISSLWLSIQTAPGIH
jgi:hypothetical protein